MDVISKGSPLNSSECFKKKLEKKKTATRVLQKPLKTNFWLKRNENLCYLLVHIKRVGAVITIESVGFET